VATDTLGRVSRGRMAEVLAHHDDGAAVGRHPDQLIDAPGELAAAQGAAPTGGPRSAEARP
jgi:hypothetical protein